MRNFTVPATNVARRVRVSWKPKSTVIAVRPARWTWYLPDWVFKPRIKTLIKLFLFFGLLLHALRSGVRHLTSKSQEHTLGIFPMNLLGHWVIYFNYNLLRNPSTPICKLLGTLAFPLPSSLQFHKIILIRMYVSESLPKCALKFFPSRILSVEFRAPIIKQFSKVG